jgi:hypothetical protein
MVEGMATTGPSSSSGPKLTTWAGELHTGVLASLPFLDENVRHLSALL